MAKPRAKTTSKSKPTKPPADPDRAKRLRVIRHRLQNTLGTVALLTICVVGYRAADQYVKETTPPTAPLRVVLVDPPAWLSAVEREIVAAAEPVPTTGPRDIDALKTVQARLSAEPWVKQVNQIRRRTRADGTPIVEADLDYRVPAVLVEDGGFYWLVDTEGVKLPRKFGADQVQAFMYDADQTVRVRRVVGVAADASSVGQTWDGDDLQAGIRLAALIENEPFAGDIAAIDVTNFGGRHELTEPHLVLWTRHGSAIYWGRGVDNEDTLIEADTETKLAYLRHLWGRFARVDLDRPWIDIRRREMVQYPIDDAETASANVE